MRLQAYSERDRQAAEAAKIIEKSQRSEVRPYVIAERLQFAREFGSEPARSRSASITRSERASRLGLSDAITVADNVRR